MAVMPQRHDHARNDPGGAAASVSPGSAILSTMTTPRDGRPQTLDGIELRHLRAFAAVADELSFSRAAHRLHITQPALSRQIRALEKLVGCELLRRNSRSVELTLAGEDLLASARQLLAGLDEAVTAARALGGELNVRMGRLWAPVQALHDSHADFDEIRFEYETMCAQLPVPPEVDDIERTYRWLMRHGLLPQQTVMAGDSTGGMLLLSVLPRLREQGIPLPRCVVLLCPGADFFAAEAVNPDDPAMAAEHRRFQAAYLNGHPLDDPAVNPLRADLTGLPPILIQVAAGDQFARGAHELAELAHRYGVRTTVKVYPIDSHNFQSFWSFLPEATGALRDAGQFIRDCGDEAGTSLS